MRWLRCDRKLIVTVVFGIIWFWVFTVAGRPVAGNLLAFAVWIGLFYESELARFGVPPWARRVGFWLGVAFLTYWCWSFGKYNYEPGPYFSPI